MIEKFNSATITLIGAEIEQSLSAIAEKHGISIRAAGGTFDDTNAVLKLALMVRDSAGEPITPERADFARFAHEYGLEPTDLDREFVFNGYRWKVAGLKTGRPRYPVLARKSIDGRLYKLSADAVKFALSREESKSEQSGTGTFLPQLRLLGSEGEGE